MNADKINLANNFAKFIDLFACMRLFIITFFCLFIQHNYPVAKFQGTYTYSYENGKTEYAPAGYLEVHYINKDDIRFYLEVYRSTDMNSGALYGKLTYNKINGNYEYLPKDTIDNCKLIFIKKKNKIIIKTVAGNCPFGYGVYADGTYYLRNSSNPTTFINRSGKKIYFDKTSPDNYLQ